MIKRYQRPIFDKIWHDRNKYQQFLKIELANLQALHLKKIISDTEMEKLNKASFKLKDIYEIEQEIKHDVIAFVQAVGLSLGNEKKWFHYGLTSTDVVDSAQALILKQANKQIEKNLKDLLSILKEKALQYKYTPIIGRTHGIHAEITSFGLKFLLWYEDINRLFKQFKEARKAVEVIKLSGAVGNYANSSLEHEELVSKILKIPFAKISTQTLQRDRHAFYLSNLALIGAQIEKMAVEIRHLSRTEVNEIEESFTKNQKGSSAMPHKKNPIASENLTGLSRVLRGYMLSAYENVSLWHERDISHSSVERIILADATTLLDYMLNRLGTVLSNLVVNEDQMLENINLTRGVIHSQKIIHALINQGMLRDDAYLMIQKLAHKALKEKIDFKQLIENEPSLNKINLKELFSIDQYLIHVDSIFKRILT
ncbi:MAG: adenylosuccinate lyase [Acholeplasmataceae bacterium]